jgi:uncharacterized protein YjhX (UPF0386 family)
MTISRVQLATLHLIAQGYDITTISEARGVTTANTYQVIWKLAEQKLLTKKIKKESVYEITEAGLTVLGGLAAKRAESTPSPSQQ